MIKCDICDGDASFEDEMQNHYCEDCMEKAILEEGKEPEDFESIFEQGNASDSFEEV